MFGEEFSNNSKGCVLSQRIAVCHPGTAYRNHQYDNSVVSASTSIAERSAVLPKIVQSTAPSIEPAKSHNKYNNEFNLSS